MNKICIDTRNYDLNILDDSNYSLENINNNSCIKIHVAENKNANISFLIKESNLKIEIDLEKNSSLILNQLGINSSIDYSCKLLTNSNLTCTVSVLANVDSINSINIIHEEGFSNANFLVNGINLNENKLYFQLNGIIKKESLNVNLEENSKIINLKNGDSKIIPNLIVDNKDVVAIHSAFIGTFQQEDIWYLNSRGITTSLAKKLLLKAILLSGMQLTFDKDKFIDNITKMEIDI